MINNQVNNQSVNNRQVNVKIKKIKQIINYLS